MFFSANHDQTGSVANLSLYTIKIKQLEREAEAEMEDAGSSVSVSGIPFHIAVSRKSANDFCAKYSYYRTKMIL
jgi:hypothetical protein